MSQTCPRSTGALDLASVTKAGAIALGLGVCGWAWAEDTRPTFCGDAPERSGLGCDERRRHQRDRGALVRSSASDRALYGLQRCKHRRGRFLSLWVAAIASLGFGLAAILIAVVTTVVVWLADRLFSRRLPQRVCTRTASEAVKLSRARCGLSPRRDRLAPCCGSIGVPHPCCRHGARSFRPDRLAGPSFSLLVPALGSQFAGLAVATATGSAIAGRMLGGWLLTPGIARRLVAAGNYGIQIAASLLIGVGGR